MTAANGLHFESPPPAHGETHDYDWTSIAEQLRANPGEWAIIFEKDRSSLTTAIRNGGIVALRPSKGFEVKTRNNTRDEPRTCSLYMRYVPALDREG